MTSTNAAQKNELVDGVAADLAGRVRGAPGETAAEFARQYFAHVALEDLLIDDAENLAGLALAHLNFGRERAAGAPLVRVYNPVYDEHGWASTHTVLEVVVDDMPFLVDSVTIALNRLGLTVHRLIHPVVRLERDASHLISRILAPTAEGRADSFMHFEVDRQTDARRHGEIAEQVRAVLLDVRLAVRDWRAMRERLLAIAASEELGFAPVAADELEETRAFLYWVADDHFTFLGYRGYEVVRERDDMMLCGVDGSGLGILSADPAERECRSFSSLPAEQRALALGPSILIVTKTNALATVHRPSRLDYIGVKQFDAQGQVVGEHRFLGLHSSAAYSALPRDIPLLRRKVASVLQRAALPSNSHGGKALQHILDTYPRDELIQASDDELLETSVAIMHLEERRRLRLFMRKDPFGRFVTCLVYVPRERYTTELRVRMQEILTEALNGTSAEFLTRFSESVLARVRYTIYTEGVPVPAYSVPELEARLRDALLSWEEKLQGALLAQCGEEKGNALFVRYERAFTAAYKDDYSARSAVGDVLRLEDVRDGQPFQMHLYRPVEDPEGPLRLKVYGPRTMVPLSDLMPVLENMGLSVVSARPYEFVTREREPLWLLEFDLSEAAGVQVEAVEVRAIFQEALASVWTGAAENDGFNRLVLGAGLAWRDVVVLRAYCKYLLQTRMPFSQAYVEQALFDHGAIAKLLIAMFHARFDPQALEAAAREVTALKVSIDEALEAVTSLDQDRILRKFLAMIEATTRTNFYQAGADGAPKPYVSFKFDPLRIPDLPLPRPMFEIFVYSPRVEAVHLRGGPVARGGLRWSDRKEDFRTEVLGLVKAQMVKNAVIVPVGSKGGFVCKRLPESREAIQEEVLYCYRSFIRGMLDLTDNLVDGAVVAPPQLVRHDRDDPYLVVAADKGTATFSDVANGIAQEYGFWLGDAFASGGSVGYDHKKMAITARGAWESVKRHFRELGKNIQAEEFTAVGVGDMSGDVFGNGMLLSRKIRLVAAFDHRHIFVDPQPDAERSFAERERLFALPRSSWADYDTSLISPGGGVWPRSAKSIALSEQARASLGVDAASLAPAELIRAILKAPVELLWNGGIGTYVKATTETHADVGDRASEAVRIDAPQLRVKVVGEGGNLGVTQRGRIEAAARGVLVLTDAIDNSGGVNCSDHEVNIKILLAQVVRAGDMTEKQRNQLLVEMTDDVAQLVLRENYLQPQAISMARARASELLPDHVALIRALEKSGKLDRAIEFLPDDEELRAREAAGRGLTGPEIAVLLAYAKIALFEQLIASDVPEDPLLHKDLIAYFPPQLRERFAAPMETHPLRREIITTYITNSMLDRMGPSFAIRLRLESGANTPSLARAYAAAREIFDVRAIWREIQALDNVVPARLQTEMLTGTQRLVDRATLWLLRNRRPPLSIEAIARQFGDKVAALARQVPSLLPPSECSACDATTARLVADGTPQSLAERVACLDLLYCALDIVEVADQAAMPLDTVGAVYFGVYSGLDLAWLRGAAVRLGAAGQWQARAKAALVDGVYDEARKLTTSVLRGRDAGEPADRLLDAWRERNADALARVRATFDELRAAERPDLAMLSVALGEVGALARAD
ncbi:MAG TPA: NAD-glutamate dehydrogenase [Burkholderiaceae bacterium]